MNKILQILFFILLSSLISDAKSAALSSTQKLPIARQHIAINDQAAVSKAIKNGCDINAKYDKTDDDFEGATAVHAASRLGYKNLLSLLIKNKAEVNITDNNGKTALQRLLEKRLGQEEYFEIAKVLIEAGSSASQESLDSNYFVYANLEAIKRAIDLGVDVNAKFKKGLYKEQCPLEFACKFNNTHLAKLLIECNADVNALGNLNCTPLMAASNQVNLELVQLLLGKKANVNSQNSTGDTALSQLTRIISAQNSELIFKELLDAGADIKIRNIYGKNFIDLIDELADFRIAPLGRQKFISVYHEFLFKKLLRIIEDNKKTEEDRKAEIIEIFKIAPEVINKENEFGETPLSVAILFGRLDIIKYFFENTLIKILINIDRENLVYAGNLGQPFADPKKQIYRDIYKYLHNKLF